MCNDLFVQALWLYRRFLSQYWIKNFYLDASCSSDHKRSVANEMDTYVDDELQLLRSCTSLLEDDFEDYEAQAMFAATYILWIIKVTDFLQIARTIYKLLRFLLFVCRLKSCIP